MNIVITSLTLAAAVAYVAHQLWRCLAAALETDLLAYMGREEEVHQLLDMTISVTSILFGGWYSMAFFYFQNYPEEASHARFVPSEYLAFFTSVTVSLMVVKAVLRRLPPCQRSMRKMKGLACALVGGVMATALVIAASKVGGYALLVLVPEAIAFAAWCATKADKSHALPIIYTLPGPRWQYGTS